ncbi:MULTISPECIES: FAD-dependent monooxygenase [unclassified Mycolicibacterium]|uniref:FAD-dependent monooxygenase n=1 Tax=unclassified Mycolicibacterium TaxID=2636767 RepID=UPI0012DC1DFF|nr:MULTISPECIES: FAD-dependent monooxygenase [unclassified Mycolicibacterium]MUL84490.1 FAD-binding protein [Mycolicibacterium sp. CBMA 329]MUL88265.1 FAD-binding protein [Mycolicibacterium sp. CBMA 331]MUL99286.1 FAD-binding protein [Mycolicibacterium sp. CBMA 334]MUM28109.1 FAD-binding protein [Mycolicibacterium sp. CBMA 295]MUM39912.1 FAD-binding protein [Mycolicibacterium sp. CBMA 247]
MDIAIIGAGLGGLAAAVALQHQGHRPIVFDKTRELGEVGGPLGISPQTLRLLDQWTIVDSFNEISSATRYFENRDQRGRLEKITDYAAAPEAGAEHGRFGYADADVSPRTVHRADLHDLLVSAVGSENVRLRHQLDGITEREDHVELTFTGGETLRAGLVIAADGLRSTVRKIFSNDEIHYCGSVIFRAVGPAECLEAPNDRLRSWHSADYAKHVISMPVRAGRQVAVDATLGVDEPPLQLWSAQAEPALLAAQFGEFDPAVGQMLRAATSPVYMHPVYDRDPIDRWTTARVALLGDAAHPMTPFGGQGANQAIQDAAELAAQIATVHDGDYTEALQRYQRIRTEQTAEIQRAARGYADRRATVALRLADILAG